MNQIAKLIVGLLYLNANAEGLFSTEELNKTNSFSL